MDETLRAHLNNLYTTDRELQNTAFFAVLAATDVPVDWAYDVWDRLVQSLAHTDNHVRAIAAQVLCNLAKSDPENRMQHDFETLLAVTKDERFVTARHTLQAIWKVGAAGEPQRALVLDGLERRFHECASEKNCTLIRFDICQSLRGLYDAVGDERVRQKALILIDTETDTKYRRKYAAVWKTK